MFRILSVLVVIGCLTACSKSDPGSNNTTTGDVPVISIHLNDQYQTIHNFSASDAWACQYIGQWPNDKRQQVANWLFSTGVDASGKPLGIGLSMWRFNIGAGSAAQTNIGDEWRRAEGFLQDNGTYDWSKQAGQQWMLKAAKDLGVNQFLAFTNSPPVQMTRNGKGYSSDPEHGNLAPEKYKAFAAFLADVVQYFNQQGIDMGYLSPFNEPQWDWTGNGQEGTPFTNAEMAAITRKIDSVLTARNMTTRLVIGEAGKMNYLYEAADKPSRGNQIEAFFKSGSSEYIGNLTHVDPIISAHSYFTSAPMTTMAEVRRNVAAALPRATVPLKFWQSEYCILGDQEEIPGGGKDTGMTTALYVARLIHHDLTLANAAAWQWWTAVSVYDYKDGLIYADKNKTNGTVEDTKLLWALGHYSRFIRPGYVRVNNTADKLDISLPTGLMVSSYLGAADGKLVTVVVNYGNIDTAFKIAADGKTISGIRPYITSSNAADDLRPLTAVTADSTITIPKKSILTLVSDIQP